MTSVIKIAAALVCLAVLSSFQPSMSATSGQKVYVIGISGMVEPGMAAFVRRAIQSVPQDGVPIFLFKMDTFGGRVDAAFEIVEAISAIPAQQTIAYVEKKAISAGALIALSAGTIVMKDNTLIGDCAPMIQSSEGHKEAGEKTQTVLRAQFRTLARRNGYPQVLAEAMVTKAMEVYEVTLDDQTRYMDNIEYQDLSGDQKKQITRKKTIVKEGQLLTMDDREAHVLGFSKHSVEDLDQALGLMGYDTYETVVIQESWSEKIVRVLQPFLPVLMLIGLGALYTEIKAPGFGVPGIIGLICLGLVFFNQHLAGLADYTELLMFLAGFLLLGVEVFVLPGFGIAGVSALVVIAAGLVLSFQGFVLPDPALPWEGALMVKNIGLVMASGLGALGVSFFMIRFVLPRLAFVVKGPYLDTTLKDAHADSRAVAGILETATGISVTPLRPAGKVRIENRRIDAVTQGEFIDPGVPVRVVKVAGNQVIVVKNEGDL